MEILEYITGEESNEVDRMRGEAYGLLLEVELEAGRMESCFSYALSVAKVLKRGFEGGNYFAFVSTYMTTLHQLGSYPRYKG